MADKEIMATGRRKTSIAVVKLVKGKGRIIVNGKILRNYIGNRPAIEIRHGISRALVKSNEEYRNVLRLEGLLTRDPRVKERKKYGRKRARKRFQFSKR